MIKLLQRNMALQVVLILAVLILLWLRPLTLSPAMDGGDHPAILYSLLCQWFASLPRLAVVIAMLLVLAEGIMLNLLLANVNLVSQSSLLPTLLYIVAMSAGATTLTPLVLVNAALIACLNQLMLRGTLLTISLSKACGATLLIGIASLFYQPAALLILSYLLIAANYRLYSWRDWAVMILGFAAPYLMLILVLFMTDSLAGWWQQTLASLIPSLQLGSTSLPSVASIVLAGIFLWSILLLLGRMSERPVLWQRNASTVLLCSVGALGMMFFSTLIPIRIALFAIPFCFSTNRMLTSAFETATGFGRKRQRLWIYDSLLVLILIAAFLC